MSASDRSMNIRPTDAEDEPVFSFDERFTSDEANHLSYQTRSTVAATNVSSHEDPFMAGETEDLQSNNTIRLSKGKGVAFPSPIEIPEPNTSSNEYRGCSHPFPQEPIHRLWSVSESFQGFASPSASTSYGENSLRTPSDSFLHRAMSAELSRAADSTDGSSSSGSSKGKGRALPHALPPLSFSPISVERTEDPFTSFLSASFHPSSTRSDSTNSGSQQSSPSPSSLYDHSTAAKAAIDKSSRMPTRSHSMNSLYILSDISPTSQPAPKLKLRFTHTRTKSTLARKLLLRKYSDGNTPCIDDTTDKPIILPSVNHSNDKDLVYAASYAHSPALPKPRSSAYFHRPTMSAPPLLSAFDLIPVSSVDMFSPISISLRNLFNETLPRELQLRILADVVHLHCSDHDRLIRDEIWSFGKASSSRNRWISKEKGLRELIKFGRVSKAWRDLVFDGQLWSHFDLRAFPAMSPSAVLSAVKKIGPFVRRLDISGHAYLRGSTLIDMTDQIRVGPKELQTYTQLTSVNLSGCKKLTTRSLHHLLIRSPSLLSLSVKGLTAVTNSTFDIIGTYCPRLQILDAGRCVNMDGQGLRSMCSAVLDRDGRLHLRQLRVSHLKYINDDVMRSLGKASPDLEVLDLSYAQHLHNSALEAFVACDEVTAGIQTVILNARQAGREVGDSTMYRRRITRIRHLNLSSCSLLTDVACSNLAYTMPELEFLELAGIGAPLKDDGLVHLLQTTPRIRRLDLEDASSITDAVLAMLTPDEIEETTLIASNRPTDPEVGAALESLVVSHINGITNEAMLNLVRRSTRLKVLEADDTRISSTVLREFVNLARKRKMLNARIVAIDCRGVSEHLVKQLTSSTRPRLGWRAYEAKKLDFVDGRDDVTEELKIGQDECDEARVVLKTFYSWQTVDTVLSGRESRRKANQRRQGNVSNSSDSSRSSKWWGRASRSGSGSATPIFSDGEREGCVLM